MSSIATTSEMGPPDLEMMKSPKEEPVLPFGARFAVRLEDVEWKLVCALSGGSDCSDDHGSDPEQIEVDPGG